MPRCAASFRPAWWLPGPHLQTLWPTFFRSRPSLALERERFELEDGDFVDLAWTGRSDGDVVIVLHGLEGSLQSHYVRGLLDRLGSRGFRACFMHFRGCSGEPNRLARSYHSGDTGDVQHVAEVITNRLGRPLHGAVGFSLGGNVLLKWLGEQGAAALVQRAVAVSVPFRLNDAALRLEQGVSRLYQRHLIRRLHKKFHEKFNRIPCPLDVEVNSLTNFRQFDNQVTAPLHGFTDVDDYYDRSSSRQFLGAIRVPTLLLHARDDPFMYPETAPEDQDLANCVRLELAHHGGHVGFVSGNIPGKARYWLDNRILTWLCDAVDHR